jgi:hypothetical protein
MRGSPVSGADGAPGAQERWGRLYAIVLGVLVVEIAGLWALARVFQ